MNDYYEEVLGTNEEDIWKANSACLYEYFKINTLPNIALSDIRKELFRGDIKEANAKLNNVKITLAEFGKKWFEFAIYNALEKGQGLSLGPTPEHNFSVEDYLLKSFYNLNFLRMRKNQLEGKAKEADAITKKLLDVESRNIFLEQTREYVRTKGTQKRLKQKIKDNAVQYLEFVERIPKFIYLLSLSPYMIVGDKNKGCPYQTSRFYSEMITDKTGGNVEPNDPIFSSEVHKELFLQNWGLDKCTAKEYELFKNTKENLKEFDRISRKWNYTLVLEEPNS